MIGFLGGALPSLYIGARAATTCVVCCTYAALESVDLVHTGGLVGEHPPTLQAATDGSLVVGEGTTPIPARVVRTIQSGQFTDFAELLPDNLELSSGGCNPEATMLDAAVCVKYSL